MPPSLAILEERLKKRGSESTDSLHKRIAKAKGEIARSGEFDKVILNDNFDIACEESMRVIRNFIKD
jgi:guanylate kinase